MREIADETQVIVPAEMLQEEVALLFEKYDLTTSGVVDQDGRLIGMITVDDVMEVAREEFEEDVLLLGGVGEETVDDSVIQATLKRFTWLLVNLGTAILASMVIGLFDGTLKEMVALAVLNADCCLHGRKCRYSDIDHYCSGIGHKRIDHL